MIYVLYHQSCLDGFGAAYAAWKVFGDKAEYVSVNYQEPWPAEVDSTNSLVYVLDFSYDKETLQREEQKAQALLVLDHHKGAEEDLKDLPFAVFDLEHSGAVLAWAHFHPMVPVPKLLLHIEDRDLWKFEMRSTEAICETLWSYPRDFERWEHYITDPAAFKRLKAEGNLLVMAKRRVVGQICYGAFVCSVAGRRVVACNTPFHISDVCQELLKRHPDCEFAISFRMTKTRLWRWSFRSRKESGVNVSEVAKLFGGGGNENAAGADTKDIILR